MTDRILPDRVLLLVATLQVAGPPRLVVALAKGLRARHADVRVAHLGSGDWGPAVAELRAHGVPVIDLRLRSLFDPRPVLRLASYLRRERIQVLHTHDRYAHLVGRPAAAIASCPLVSTDHWIVETDTGFRGRIRCALDDATGRVFGGERVMVSRAQRVAHERTGRLRGARVATVPTGVDADAFRPDPVARRQFRAELGIPDAVPVLANVAVLRPGKGHEDLLAALVAIRDQIPGVHLLVAGDGSERARLEGTAAALGVAGAVTFLGTRADVPRVLAAADVYVHPSHFETFPTSVLEAMAVGLPVVATDVGGVPEMITDDVTGLLVRAGRPRTLAGAVARALRPGTGTRLGAAARAWVEANGSVGAWLDRHEAVYRAAAGRGSR